MDASRGRSGPRHRVGACMLREGFVALVININFAEDRAEGRVPDVLLDGQRYELRFTWNTRFSYWAISMFEQVSGTALFQGRRMALGVNHLRQVASPLRPGGALVVVDTSGQGLSPGRGDLRSGRVKLVYRTAAEVSE